MSQNCFLFDLRFRLRRLLLDFEFEAHAEADRSLAQILASTLAELCANKSFVYAR